MSFKIPKWKGNKDKKDYAHRNTLHALNSLIQTHTVGASLEGWLEAKHITCLCLYGLIG